MATAGSLIKQNGLPEVAVVAEAMSVVGKAEKTKVWERNVTREVVQLTHVDGVSRHPSKLVDESSEEELP